MNSKKLIFIYGSLKRNFDNHYIIEKARYKCKAKTVRKLDMFQEESANYPYLLNRTTNQSHHIKGELYEIYNENFLLEIDRFEDAPNYYKISTIKVKIYNGKIKKADVYFLKDKRVPKNQTPMAEWKESNSFLEEFEKYYNRCQ